MAGGAEGAGAGDVIAASSASSASVLDGAKCIDHETQQHGEQAEGRRKKQKKVDATKEETESDGLRGAVFNAAFDQGGGAFS